MNTYALLAVQVKLCQLKQDRRQGLDRAMGDTAIHKRRLIIKRSS